jgi:hypothetical protein
VSQSEQVRCATDPNSCPSELSVDCDTHHAGEDPQSVIRRVNVGLMMGAKPQHFCWLLASPLEKHNSQVDNYAGVNLMLSKCFNPHCSANFRYLGQGRLYRIDRTKTIASALIIPEVEACAPCIKTHPLEHFWLCDKCAITLTIGLDDTGRVRLVPLKAKTEAAEARPAHRLRAS